MITKEDLQIMMEVLVNLQILMTFLEDHQLVLLQLKYDFFFFFFFPLCSKKSTNLFILIKLKIKI